MKKLITIGLVTLALCGVAFAGSYGDEIIKTVNMTTTGTTTADAVTAAIPAGEQWSILGVYQGVTTQTNTCLLKRILKGLTTSEAVTVETLAAVANTSAIETVGEGDVSADIDPIILTEGDILWMDATGADATNVVYKLLVKRTKQ